MKTAPTLTELFNSISSDLKNKFSINSENDLKRVLSALAASDAGMLKLFYLALIDVQKNLWPDLADPESMGGTLERFGRIKLGRDPYPATQGKYTITVTGVTGTTLKAGTQYVNKTTGYYYSTTDDITFAGSTATATVLSDKSGLNYKLSTGDTLFTVNTIVNIDSPATVGSILILPTDAEDIEVYRSVVLQAFRLEPNGGSASDFLYWALDVSEVRSVYPYTGLNGSAIIYVEAKLSNSTDGKGSAYQTTLDKLWKSDKTGVFELSPDTTLSNYERGRRQLGFTDLTLSSVTPLNVVVTISNLKTHTESITIAIQKAISYMLFYKRPYIPGIGDINDRNDTLYFRDIVTSLDSALESGNTYDDVTVTVNGLPLPFQFINGNIPYLSSIVYV